MQTQIKRYNIQLKGKVQHIGYRGIIESTARKLDIKGYVFNNIESIEKSEIQDDLYLPSVFSRLATDDYYEFGKKFDVGIDFLSEIKTDTGEMKNSLAKLNTTLETFVMKQDEHSIKQDEHNRRLEKILEKLVEN